MISCILRGRLGNQMHIAATTIAHALKHNTDYCFPSRSGKRNQFDFMFPHLPIDDNFKFDTYHKEREFGAYNEILPPIGNQLLQGYFQSELYFKEYRKEIITAFGLPKYLTQIGTVGVHVRRGDYVTRWSNKHPSVTLEYVAKALYKLNEVLFCAGDKLAITKVVCFSDDIEYCKNLYPQNLSQFNWEFCNEQDPKIAMSIMASCEHNIIANSSFSWWAAYLNPNPDKIIVSPHENNWFGPTYKQILNTQDIIPKTWKRIEY